MIKIIKNCTLYSPFYIGKKDILILENKIAKIDDFIEVPSKKFYEVEVIDASDEYAVPGFIDLHVHIDGAGGEGGYTTRTPEINLSDIIKNGITTAIGLLGTDGTTRSLSSLLAKARALEEEGINTMIWTGCYQYPTRTITDSLRDDIILIDKVIGAGEIALSDHRGSRLMKNDIERLISECRVGGMLSGKCGVLQMHIGDDPEGILPLIEIIHKYPALSCNILPTHINRNINLLNQAVDYLKAGGFVDLTTGIYQTKFDKTSLDASYTFDYLLKKGCSPNNITMSSDSNGSMPIFDENGRLEKLGVGNIKSDFIEFKKLVTKYNIPLETALKPFTLNPARFLKLNNLGLIEGGLQADILLLDKNLNIDYLICKGSTLVQHGNPVRFGTFENGKV